MTLPQAGYGVNTGQASPLAIHIGVCLGTPPPIRDTGTLNFRHVQAAIEARLAEIVGETDIAGFLQPGLRPAFSEDGARIGFAVSQVGSGDEVKNGAFSVIAVRHVDREATSIGAKRFTVRGQVYCDVRGRYLPSEGGAPKAREDALQLATVLARALDAVAPSVNGSGQGKIQAPVPGRSPIAVYLDGTIVHERGIAGDSVTYLVEVRSPFRYYEHA